MFVYIKNINIIYIFTTDKFKMNKYFIQINNY